MALISGPAYETVVPAHVLEVDAMGWPKTILVRGLPVPIESWEEFDELVARYGGEALVIAQGQPVMNGHPPKRSTSSGGAGSLSRGDRALLQMFIEGGNRGVLVEPISGVVGKRGKGVRPALERWSQKIGLVSEGGAFGFEPVKRADGRGYRLNDIYLRGARSLLGE
jgi:hypothetical protein